MSAHVRSFGPLLWTCAVLVAAVGAADFSPDEVPSWVELGEQREISQAHYDRNLQQVAMMNKEGEQYDLVLYGDSLVAAMETHRGEAWDTIFDPADVLAQPLGMGGSTVEELAARLVFGRETPDIAPRVVVLLIGYNNARYVAGSDPADKVDWLLQWLAHHWPNTQLALSALVSNAFVDLTDLNSQYREVAQNRGALFFDCNEGLDPESDQFEDGTHWAPEGQVVWLDCMRGAVSGLLDGYENTLRSGNYTIFTR